ncbi:MAG: 1,4-dihydroxy-2-naphthoate octaprenyltransferase [candidate division KSB1 bacterium]|nr:1,4-dihydroxy-2-naphthoate octaprenyltransferase [candidate division KSB1 bacterium]
MNIKTAWKAARPFSLTVSFFPPLLGGLLAAAQPFSESINGLHLVITVLGSMLVHAGVNMFSDIKDFDRGVDRPGTFGGSRVLLDKDLSKRELLLLAVICFALAAVIGVYFILILANGFLLLYPILIGALLGLFYTYGPLPVKYHALGDPAVFIAFGPAMAAGAFFVQAGFYSLESILYPLPFAFLVIAILHANNLRDIQNDKQVNIRTLAMLLGERGSQVYYTGLLAAAYISVLILILFAGLSLFTLSVFFTLPLALQRVKLIWNKRNLSEQEFIPVDALTAQLHMAFSLVYLVSLILDWMIL